MRTFKVAALALAGCATDADTTDPDPGATAADELAPQVMTRISGLTARDKIVEHHRLPAADGIDHVRYHMSAQ
jgi:hypothetical protein